ncbi:LADA_0H13300g1_1 [Lachancea dasiensis]|uniref:LADA_0H13300g1_1 n=1 Tax=Lachancea dasiensis TaxID=1072105 RepID=A0A1G4K421_9SACH|nr:LADA_0H13300g1_1 [Lachancea dasiensis]
MESCKSKTESRLLQSLNQFIGILAHLEDSSQTSTSASSKLAANYLRLNLLSQLRHFHSVADGVKKLDSKERDILVQWWITLLNFLNSDCRGQELDSGHPLISTDVCSVALECVSRILTLTGLAATSKRELEIVAYHTLLTVHYVTNRLIFNTKRRKVMVTSKQLAPAFVKQQLNHLTQYNTLLNSFMGKLMAYAFFYLEASFYYDYLVLDFLEPGVYPAARSFTAFPWKTKDYKPGFQKIHINPQEKIKEQDKKIFRIMISYLKNDAIFMGFYWHYWHIALTRLSAMNVRKTDPQSVPGCKLLIRYISKNLDTDISAFTRFLRSQESDSFLHTRPNGQTTSLTSEQLNNFVFVNFKTIKLWECLRALVGCLDPAIPELLCSLIRLHDDLHLKRLAKIPAHDYQLANLMYNRILQFILFQFETMNHYLMALDWRKWSDGLRRMLESLNVNCQSVALLSLFNIWDFLPMQHDLRAEMSTLLVVDMWNSLGKDTYFDVVRILFFKIVVFRLLNDSSWDNSMVKNQIADKLLGCYQQAVQLAEILPKQVQPNATKDSLIFHINKKLILSKVDPVNEDTLIRDYETSQKSTDKKHQILIPSVLAVTNVRPSFLISQGRYPFDILDEMVLKAARKAAQQRRENAVADAKFSRQFSKSRSTSISSKSTNESALEEDDETSVASALGSFLSKFGNSSSTTSKKAKASLSERLARGTYGKHRKASDSVFSTDTKQDSESVEIMSMYSSLSLTSSLSANRSCSSLELRTQQSNISSDSLAQRMLGVKEELSEAPSSPSQKKKKLLAPSELKFSKTVSDSTPIQWFFRLVTAPMSGSSSSAIAKVQEANDRWGIFSARTYDKPLPPTVANNLNTELDDTFDVSSVTAGMKDLDVSGKPMAESREQYENSISSNTSEVPYPDLGSLGLISSTLPTTNLDDRTITFDSIEERPIDSMDCLLRGTDSGVKLTKRTAGIMREETELSKLIKLLDVYNDTVAERTHFLNLMHDTRDKVILDSEISSFRGPQSSGKNLVNAQIEYL